MEVNGINELTVEYGDAAVIPSESLIRWNSPHT